MSYGHCNNLPQTCLANMFPHSSEGPKPEISFSVLKLRYGRALTNISGEATGEDLLPGLFQDLEWHFLHLTSLHWRRAFSGYPPSPFSLWPPVGGWRKSPPEGADAFLSVSLGRVSGKLGLVLQQVLRHGEAQGPLVQPPPFRVPIHQLSQDLAPLLGPSTAGNCPLPFYLF